VTYGSDRVPTHEAVTHAACAKQVAALTGASFAGEYCSTGGPQQNLYFVPSRALMVSEAERLGIRGEDDLFGGIVPAAFVATKAISHPLIGPDFFAPPEWSRDFEAAVRDVVLGGVTVFSMREAQRVGEKLVELGPMRVKPTGASGAQGQVVVTSNAELTSALADIDGGELQRCGLVFEQNLTDCATVSVGSCHIAGLRLAYFGTQRFTRNNIGETAYGGSDLFLVAGDWRGLLTHELAKPVRLAVEQALQFDAAVGEFYPSMVASRRNYDVAQGIDWKGNWRSGVLEQSWRIGGATPAELTALAAFKADPGLKSVRTSSVEIYGTDASSIPPGAVVYFEGTDEQMGPMLKYAVRHADS
jgi:hypothetical protein